MEMGLIAEQLVIGIPPLCTRQRGLVELDGSLDRDSSGIGYCNRSSSLKTVVLKMHSSDPGEEAVFACGMFKNKAKSLQIQALTNTSLCTTTGAQGLKFSLYFASYLHDFSKVMSFALCT